MNLTWLRSFYYVISCGGVQKAAAYLHVSHTTLSVQIKNLERQYKVLLFVKVGRKLTPTRIGWSLYERSKKLFAQEERIENFLHKMANRLEGSLCIGAINPVSVMFVVSKLMEENPTLEYQLMLGNTDEVWQGLYGGKCDVIIAPVSKERTRKSEFDVRSIPIIRDALCLIAHKEYYANSAIDIQNLAQERLLLRTKGSLTAELFKELLVRHNVEVQNVLELSSREGVFEAVRNQLGIGVALRRELVTFDQHITAIDVHKDGNAINMPSVNEHIVYSRDNESSEALSWFVDRAISITKEAELAAR